MCFLRPLVTSIQFEVQDLSRLEIGISQLSFMYLVAEAAGVNEVPSTGRRHRRNFGIQRMVEKEEFRKMRKCKGV